MPARARQDRGGLGGPHHEQDVRPDSRYRRNGAMFCLGGRVGDNDQIGRRDLRLAQISPPDRAHDSRGRRLAGPEGLANVVEHRLGVVGIVAADIEDIHLLVQRRQRRRECCRSRDRRRSGRAWSLPADPGLAGAWTTMLWPAANVHVRLSAPVCARHRPNAVENDRSVASAELVMRMSGRSSRRAGARESRLVTSCSDALVAPWHGIVLTTSSVRSGHS